MAARRDGRQRGRHADATKIERQIHALLDAEGQADWWIGVMDEAGYCVALLWDGALVDEATPAPGVEGPGRSYRIWRVTWDQKPAWIRLSWRHLRNEDGNMTSSLRPAQDLALAIHPSARRNYW
jgi:hypothetical protein